MSEPATITQGFYGESGFDISNPPMSLFVFGDLEEEDRNPTAPRLRPDIIEWCNANLSGRYGTGMDYERLVGDEMSFRVGSDLFIINTMVMTRAIRFEFEKDLIHFKMMYGC